MEGQESEREKGLSRLWEERKKDKEIQERETGTLEGKEQEPL